MLHFGSQASYTPFFLITYEHIWLWGHGQLAYLGVYMRGKSWFLIFWCKQMRALSCQHIHRMVIFIS